MSLPLLEGEVERQPGPDERDLIIRGLRDHIRELEESLRTERKLTAVAEDGLRELRHVLKPLYSGLQKVFGEFDAMGISDSQNGAERLPAEHSKVWKSWMDKLPGMPAKFIEVMLEHGEMSVAQIRVAAHCGQQTVYDVASKLHKLGLLNKNGGKYSLKEL